MVHRVRIISPAFSGKANPEQDKRVGAAMQVVSAFLLYRRIDKLMMLVYNEN